MPKKAAFRQAGHRPFGWPLVVQSRWGRIDRRITLDIGITRREEGGPVVDAGGGSLGMSTFGPRGHVLVIPASTVDTVLEPLLSRGRIERGWSVVRPDDHAYRKGQPPARVNLHAGDILVTIAGEHVTSPTMLARHLDRTRSENRSNCV